MSKEYSHSYEDPETGEIVDIWVADDDEDDKYRSAVCRYLRDHRQRASRRRTGFRR